MENVTLETFVTENFKFLRFTEVCRQDLDRIIDVVDLLLLLCQ